MKTLILSPDLSLIIYENGTSEFTSYGESVLRLSGYETEELIKQIKAL